MCRRQHGTAFATYAKARVSSLTIVAGEDALATYASSTAAERKFCGSCGSKLFYCLHQTPDSIWVAAGALDDDPGVQVEHHIFTANQAPWYEISDALPRHEGFADDSV